MLTLLLGIKMNDNEVFQKSDLGRQEIKSQSLGVLPREARTLLIMIDGKRTYQSYMDALDNSKMFADFGGIAPLFELLLGLECIESVGSNSNAPQTRSATQVPTAVKATQDSQSQPISKPLDKEAETEFDHTFNNSSTNKIKEFGKKSIGSMFKAKPSDASYDTIKSDLATYIEKNAPPEEAWGYLLSLEQCEDSSQLLILADDIQSSSSGNLARGMNDFIKKIQR